MAEYGIEAEFDNKEVKSFIRNMSKKLKHVSEGETKYTGLISSIVFQDVIDHFEKESGPMGKWKEWSPWYSAHMNSIGRGGNKILQWTGRLKQSFLPTNVRKTKDGPLWFNPAKTKDGFPYAKAHDEGGTKLPQREFMWLSEKAMEKIENQTLQFMIEEGL